MTALLLQAPAAAPAPSATPAPATTATFKSEMGFSYSYPSDWESMDTKPMMPAAHLQAEQSQTTEAGKKGAACVEVGMLLKHGDPASVIISMELPWDCFGSSFTKTDLPGFGEGVSEGLKQQFVMKDATFGAYATGSHNFWIERSTGSPKDHPEKMFTIETVCSIITKGAVCWMGMVSDDTALKTFESGQVKLEADAPAALVPPTAFAEKPAAAPAKPAADQPK